MLSSKAIRIRNLLVATANAAISLILLLIAPLGLAIVITLTLLLFLSTWISLAVADGVVRYLVGRQSQEAELLQRPDGGRMVISGRRGVLRRKRR